MLVVNYVPKIQAIDKSAALLAEIRIHHPTTRMVSVVNIEGKNQITDASSLFRLLTDVSNEVIFLGDTPLHRRFLTELPGADVSVRLIDLKDTDAVSDQLGGRIAARGGAPDRRVLFVPYTSESSSIGPEIVAQLKDDGFTVVSYFKSLHDEGFGLTTVPPVTANKRSVLARVGRRLSAYRSTVTSRPASTPRHRLRTSDVDVLLAFNQDHADLVRKKVAGPSVHVSGYQLLYPAWKNLVLKSEYCRTYPQDDVLDVVVFTRGETPGRPPDQNIVPHSMLQRLLADIFDTLDATGRSYRVRIKPHPIQDVQFIRDQISAKPNASISMETPAFLAATADLAISTYSSTVVDALIFGVPSIEYFIENEFFNKKHPLGSPFGRFGAVPVRTRESFRDCVTTIVAAGDARPEFSVEDVIGNGSNLDFLSALDLR